VKLGLGSYACAWEIGVPGHLPPSPLTAIGLVARASSLGLSLVQIADNLPLERFTLTELEDLRTQAARLGVDVEVGTRGISPPHLRQFLELCRYFRSPLLRVVVDTAADRPSPAGVVDTLRDFAPELVAAGVTLAIENHDRFAARTFADIVERVGSPNVGICLDTVNSFGALEGPAVVIDTLAPFVVNLHLKDFTIARLPHMMGFEVGGAPAGQGRLDVPSLLDALRRCGRNPNAILELWPPPESDPEATVAKEVQWAKDSVAYLRTLIPN
jgi:3-oxoisoapionate decarboxylase